MSKLRVGPAAHRGSTLSKQSKPPQAVAPKSISTSLRLEVGAATDVGLKRQENEDDYAVIESTRIFSVYDGMGGHDAGALAAQSAKVIVSGYLGPLGAAVTAVDLTTALWRANAGVRSLASSGDRRAPGTTAVVAHVSASGALHASWCGDSRLYLFCRGVLTQLNYDHSPVGELVKSGQLTDEEGRKHPYRNMISSALGMDPTPTISSITPLKLAAGAVILLCTDGLNSMLSNQEVGSVLAYFAAGPAQKTAEELVANANRAGGLDNTTCVVIRVL